ncbi:MAG: alcohol dehydrogenase [Pedosphaera sp.]|nr:alcohol dehydrogenase [Pedosphaera sp.]
MLRCMISPVIPSPVGLRGTVLLFFLFSVVSNGWGADWPQYRGLNHDGSSTESIRTNWTQKPPTVVWKKTITPAWSSITVAGGRAFTQGNRRLLNVSSEFCIALNVDTGAELWATLLDDAYYPDGGTGSTDGPRSTPSVDGDYVYVFTSYLRLFCLRANTGAVVWSRDFISEFPGTSVIPWQNSASPLIVGDLIFVNSNVANQTLMAVRKSDGVTVWKGQTDTMTHATPVYATIAGSPQVVFQTLKGLVGVTPTTGAVLWRYSFAPSSTSTASTPIIADDYVYGSCAYAKGAWTARVTKSGSTFSAVQANYTGANSAYQNHWATPVHHEGFVYGIVERSSHSLACFSFVGRTNRWTTSTVGSGSPGFASLIKVGGKLVVLRESGELVLIEPNPAAYTEIARYQALTGTSWNHPTFSNGRIYARSNNQIVALDVAAPLAPLPVLKLNVAFLPTKAQLRLEVAAQNGLPLDSDASGRIELTSSTAVTGTNQWTPLTALFTLINGKFQTDVPLLLAATNQFLRMRERTNLP